MSALLPEYEGQIDLIYADPPFFTNRRYPARVGRGEDSRRPKEWQLAEGYPDHWPDIEAYLDMLYPRLALMHRLLSPRRQPIPAPGLACQPLCPPAAG